MILFLVYSIMFTGGAFGQAAVFGLGIMPYISVSIVVQILQTTLPYFQRLAQEGESGRAKINQITRYGTVILALVQSIGIAFLLESYGIVLESRFCIQIYRSSIYHNRYNVIAYGLVKKSQSMV